MSESIARNNCVLRRLCSLEKNRRQIFRCDVRTERLVCGSGINLLGARVSATCIALYFPTLAESLFFLSSEASPSYIRTPVVYARSHHPCIVLTHARERTARYEVVYKTPLRAFLALATHVPAAILLPGKLFPYRAPEVHALLQRLRPFRVVYDREILSENTPSHGDGAHARTLGSFSFISSFAFAREIPPLRSSLVNTEFGPILLRGEIQLFFTL